MKTSLLLVITMAILISCDQDSNEETNRDIPLKSNVAMEEVTLPANPSNPYDKMGGICYDILLLYPEEYYTGSISDDIQEAETLAFQNQDFITLAGGTYKPLSAEQLLPVLQASENNLSQAIASLPLSAAGGQYLTGWITSLKNMKTQDQPYDQVYDYMVAMENNILNDRSLDSSDAVVLLRTASVIRFSLYYDVKRKRRRDRDWELSVGNIIATVQEASFEPTTITGCLSTKFL